MPAPRNLKHDLAALGLSALVVFFTLALLTYNPADPPVRMFRPLDKLYPVDNIVYPPQEKASNACGRLGSLAADVLLHTLGVGAYYLVVSMAVLAFFLLSRRKISDPVLRSVGWAMALVGLTTLEALAIPRASQGPIIGAGGYLGAAGRGWLEMHFATAGAYILTLSVLLAGLLLSTDYVLFGFAARAARVPTKGLLRAGGALRARRTARTTQNDVDEDVADGLSVRIRGRRISDEVDALEDEVDAEAEDEDTHSEEEVDDEAEAEETDDETEIEAPGAAPRPGMGARLAAALRIKKNPGQEERDRVRKELEAASQSDGMIDYELPPLDLLLPGEAIPVEEHEKEVRQKAKVLEKTFANFGFQVKVVEIETGPVIAQYEVELEAGLRLSKITGLADDLAIALRVPSVRIVAPIPGKNTVGIEVPNADRHIVRLREVIEETNGKAKKMRIPIYLGKDVSGNPLVADLTTLPHLLIAGRTGTGKSVCLNSIIVSMLMTRRPDEVRMLLIDPKMVELSPYKSLPHLMHPVVTDMRKAEAILAWAVEKMEERYALLARAGVRHISVYNQLGEEELMDRLAPESDEERGAIPLHLPYIVIVADEMADLMMTAAKEVEQHIIRLAQKSRAVGIHLVLATQKPTVDVITGLIKSNLPARIAFQVSSRVDSRVVLDEMGADKLLGNGDMLFLWPGTSTLLRGQGTYLSDDEINRVLDAVSTTEPQFVKELVHLKVNEDQGEKGSLMKNRDDMYEAAVDVVIREGRGSVSLLQRALGIGYGRAARLIDFMAEDGIVGEYKGSQAREVLITLEQWAQMVGQQAAPEPAAALPKPKRNRILPDPDAEDDAGGMGISPVVGRPAGGTALIESPRASAIKVDAAADADADDEVEQDAEPEDEYDEEYEDEAAEEDSLDEGEDESVDDNSEEDSEEYDSDEEGSDEEIEESSLTSRRHGDLVGKDRQVDKADEPVGEMQTRPPPATRRYRAESA